MKMINVSIVTYHTSEDELSACLDSILASAEVSRIDIIDNGSEPRLKDFCETNYPGGRVTYTASANNGYGAGHNISISKSLNEATAYHLVMNSDVYFEPGTLETCVKYMDSHPDVGQLIPRVTFPDGSYQPVCHPLPTPFDLLIHRFAPRKLSAKFRQRYEMRCYDMSRPLNVPYHHGCFMLLRVTALKDVGLFDERFFMYPEDIDLTRRVHRRYKTIYYPGATIVHAHRAESRVNMRMLRIHAVNMLRYFAKWGFIFDKERRRFNRQLRQELSR